MKTEIKIFSDIGNTPITKRKGAFCDLLLDTVIECDSPEQAREVTKGLIKDTPYGYVGHFYMPEYWNKNTRQSWEGYGL